MTRRRICVVTGSRAEYGLLYWLLRDLHDHAAVELQVVATGMHLAHEHGETVHEIERDGFTVAWRVHMLVAGDSADATARSVGLGVIGMSDALVALRPDLVVVLGDRFEVLAAVQACLFHNVPVAHIAGGDTTEGAQDESIRHAITKMAHLHLVTNEASARRVRQLGEDPRRVHVVGSPGLDQLRRRPLLGRAELEQALGAALGPRNLLVTFHPVTLDPAQGRDQFAELLAALETVGADTTIWFTRPNADTGGRAIAAALDAWAQPRAGRVHVYTSLGPQRYLGLMAQANAVVGNSSSALYEAPSLRVPSVDIGDRQRGRLAAASVIHCEPNREAIRQAIDRALRLDCSHVVNPYGDGRSAGRITALLRDLPLGPDLLRKPFHSTAATP